MNNKAVLRVVLDEPQLYLAETSGSFMIRGEVVVTFVKDTLIQGPIELLFEGIQRYQAWNGIPNKHKAGFPIEKKLLVIELSLLPPNSKGFMPSGVQRFPFEFPIPSTLPTSVHIPDRLEIFYELTATLRRSSSSSNQEMMGSKNITNWVDWGRLNISKKKYVAKTPIRIIRAMESIVSHGLPTENNHNSTSLLSPIITQTESEDRVSNEEVSSRVINSALSQLPWDRRGLSDYHQGTLDEQHDQLAFSLSGRTISNLNKPKNMLEETLGVRYKIGVDRTAIAIGTSIGIELMIEPTFSNVIIKSVVLKVSENRKYKIEIIPVQHENNSCSLKEPPEIIKYKEGARMVMKWAIGYQIENEDGELMPDKKSMVRPVVDKVGEKYVRQRSSTSQFLAYFDPPQLGHSNNKYFLDNCLDIKPKIDMDNEVSTQEIDMIAGSSSCQSASDKKDIHDVINLKELNQSVKLGEYFGGRFVMPIPGCDSLLNPSMEYESIDINHWMQLIVTIECNGKEFDITLDSPARMLDCRVVSVGDEQQTILPPPPLYETGNGFITHDWSTGTFWEQREPITSVSGWGSIIHCPCEAKKLQEDAQRKSFSASGKHENNYKGKKILPRTNMPSNMLPEWGPPPAYEN
ncbi:hypothetical protein BD770DRAFT_399268 [Pilaira anomala]|nr:hypothetical protein BD770DRAFT_399268 [Pilaira anomala]